MHPQRDVIHAAQSIQENVAGRQHARDRVNLLQDTGVADNRRQAFDIYRTSLLTRAHPETGEVKLPGHVDDVNPITLKVSNKEPRTTNLKKELGAARKGTEDNPGPRKVRGDNFGQEYPTWMSLIQAHQKFHNQNRQPNTEDR